MSVLMLGPMALFGSVVCHHTIEGVIVFSFAYPEKKRDQFSRIPF
jgi:hypothetical protein